MTDSFNPNIDQTYEQVYNTGGQSYDVSPPPATSESILAYRSFMSRLSSQTTGEQQTTVRSNLSVQQPRSLSSTSDHIIMDRQGPHGVIRKGDIGAYGGMDGFPYLGGVCGGHSLCKDGGRTVGVANGVGSGSLEEFKRRRRTGQNKDIRLYEEALQRRPERQEN